MLSVDKKAFVNRGVEENLRFLILEVRKQVAAARLFLQDPIHQSVDRVLAKDDYIDNLKTFIRRKCFAAATHETEANSPAVKFLMAVEVITTNLERIADFCGEAVRQTHFVQERDILTQNDFGAFFDQVERGLDVLERAVFQRDTRMAIEICRREQELDNLYGEKIRSLAASDDHDTLSVLTVIFIYHYLERMGDALLNIGEAILSASLGETVKYEQYRALENSLETPEKEQPMAGVELETVAETRSGCRIGRVRHPGNTEAGGETATEHDTDAGQGRQQAETAAATPPVPERNVGTSDEDTVAAEPAASPEHEMRRPAAAHGDGELVIFKEGQLKKLLEERRGAERWQELLPGLPPRVLSFQEHGNTAAILFEYLPGQTFEDLVLRGTNRQLETALRSLFRTLTGLWRKTRTPDAVAPRFLEQLIDRLDDVYALHPDLRERKQGIGSVTVPSFEQLVERARPFDDKLQAPFSVFIHGDFNLDNIIYKPVEGTVHFIDLHRSRMMDYVQDISVLLVSILRLRVFEAPVRRRMNFAVDHIYSFAHDWAANEGDATFAARVSLGLVRSLATSARFVVDANFANDLLLRARYLLERLLAHEDESFRDFEPQWEVLLD
jgi:phosphate uptake regulator/aminoglycoside phosphotransferase (APT) family kinase protein